MQVANRISYTASLFRVQRKNLASTALYTSGCVNADVEITAKDTETAVEAALNLFTDLEGIKNTTLL